MRHVYVATQAKFSQPVAELFTETCSCKTILYERNVHYDANKTRLANVEDVSRKYYVLKYYTAKKLTVN